MKCVDVAYVQAIMVKVHSSFVDFSITGWLWHGQNNLSSFVFPSLLKEEQSDYEALEGGVPVSHIPLIFFKKYPISFKKIWQLSLNIRKLCIPIFQKLIKVSHIPLFFYQNIPYPSNFFANILISLNTLPGPRLWCTLLTIKAVSSGCFTLC